MSSLKAAVRTSKTGEHRHCLLPCSPDLYSPFWIITTLVFIFGVSVNAGLFTKESASTFQLSAVVTAASFLYSLVGLVPLCIFCLLKSAGTERPFVWVISLYSYSFLVYIPCLLCPTFSISLLQLGVLVVATCWSLALLLRNLLDEVRTAPPFQKWGVIGLLLGGHCSFTIVCVLYL